MHAGNGRKPFVGQFAEEHGAIHTGLALNQIDAVVLVGHAASGLISIGHGAKRVHRSRKNDGQGAEVIHAFLVRKNLFIRLWKLVASVVLGGALVVHVEKTGNRLLFEPLAGVALVRFCARREFRGGRGTYLAESLVISEANAEVHAEYFERAPRRLKYLFNKRVRSWGIVHSCSYPLTASGIYIKF